ncbi:hypothetical protein [Flavobacterium gelatinilyticum]|uniref:hypothetical protein n=1 Tax=Flavobacterium gelatinilyticum TaxID=3003260 RepID=UPI002480C711|nr:hypothetical protein [Flavobacterium gelatinilyticum]
MKKTILCALAAMLFAVSCQKDNSQEDNSAVSKAQKQDWLTADLNSEFANSQKKVTAYLFSAEETAKLVKTPNIKEVRFVLGYLDHTIQINMIGIDENGQKLGIVNSVILKESNYDEQLTKLNELTISKTAKRTPLLNKHLLLPQEAFKGIEAWQKKLNSVSGLDEATSHEGSRFRYFTLESAVIEAMIDKGNTSNVGLFLGLNPKEKVTTILISLDKNNAIKKTSVTSKEGDDVYDATRPCPPNGDPEAF